MYVAHCDFLAVTFLVCRWQNGAAGDVVTSYGKSLNYLAVAIAFQPTEIENIDIIVLPFSNIILFICA
jgi:hypothetical protein